MDEEEDKKKKTSHSTAPRQIMKLVESPRKCNHAHNAMELELVPLK